MRIPTWCSECATGGKLGEHSPKNEDIFMVDVEDDNAYVGRCSHGHVVAFTLDTLRFELLFESGIVALLAGFHREAVSSIAAALERFYEFSIEALAEVARVPQDLFETAWKMVSSQSERQLGAYSFVYLTTFKRPFLATKEEQKTFQEWATFRNSVVHKGQFPTRERVIEYAQYVFDLIHERKTELRHHAPAVYQEIERKQASRSRAVATEKLKTIEPKPMPDAKGAVPGVGSTNYGTMLSRAAGDGPRNFAAELELAKKNLWMWGVRARESVEARATPPDHD